MFLAGAPDYPSEAAWIAQEVERLAQRGKALGEIAVLFRAHRHRDLLVAEFRRRGIRFSIRGLSVLSTVILRDLVAYLKLADSPHDNVALTRVLLMARRKLPEGLALALREQAAKDRCSLFEALEGAERAFGLKDELAKTGWAELNRHLRELKRIALSASVTSLFDRLTEKLGLVFLPGEPDRVYTETFRKFLAEWEDKSTTRKLEEFLEYFDYFVEAGGRIEAPEPENPANAVQMMTVHAAKGLEFPVVFVMSVAPKRFPHFEQKPVIEFPEELRKGPQPPADIHLQEERRLFYVAITRARERLYISSVVKPGGKPSVFVEDLLSDPVVAGRDIERIEVPEIGPEERRASPPPPAAPGPPSRAEGETRQQRLFGDSPAPGGSTHPNLSEWASEPPRAATGEKLRLSATAIEDYRSCPLKFKFGHCMKIPTGPQAALTFGNVMHQCVRRYFELRAGGLPSFGEIEEYFLKSWKSAGFEDAYQEQTYRQAGLEQLRQFVERQNASDAAAAGTEFERRFTLDLGDVSLEGRIDRISPLRGAGPAPGFQVATPRASRFTTSRTMRRSQRCGLTRTFATRSRKSATSPEKSAAVALTRRRDSSARGVTSFPSVPRTKTRFERRGSRPGRAVQVKECEEMRIAGCGKFWPKKFGDASLHPRKFLSKNFWRILSLLFLFLRHSILLQNFQMFRQTPGGARLQSHV